MSHPAIRPGLFLVISLLLFLALSAAALGGCGQEASQEETEPDRDTFFQVSTLGALKSGFYDGVVTYAELSERGDAGIGTLEGLDGEMIAIDGDFYQIRYDGKVYDIPSTAIAPFAMVTFFERDMEVAPPGGLDYTGLQDFLNGFLPSQNVFYAIRIEGRFERVQARSVPAQEKPYPPLSEAIAEQAVFELENARGTMVGFWCPAYVGDINAPGYHLHFLTADHEAGGHVLDMRLGEVKVYIDETPEFLLQLPEMEEFLEADLTPQ